MELSLVVINIAVVLVLFSCIVMTLVGLPGNVVLFLTVFGYAFYDNFVHIDWHSLGIVLGAIVLGEIVETIMGAVWAKREKASRMAIATAVLGTIIGGLVGTVILPVIGSVIGAFVGGFVSSYIAEYRATSDKEQSWRVAKSVLKGQILGVVVKFWIAVATIIYLLTQMPWR